MDITVQRHVVGREPEVPYGAFRIGALPPELICTVVDEIALMEWDRKTSMQPRQRWIVIPALRMSETCHFFSEMCVNAFFDVTIFHARKLGKRSSPGKRGFEKHGIMSVRPVGDIIGPRSKKPNGRRRCPPLLLARRHYRRVLKLTVDGSDARHYVEIWNELKKLDPSLNESDSVRIMELWDTEEFQHICHKNEIENLITLGCPALFCNVKELKFTMSSTLFWDALGWQRSDDPSASINHYSANESGHILVPTKQELDKFCKILLGFFPSLEKPDVDRDNDGPLADVRFRSHQHYINLSHMGWTRENGLATADVEGRVAEHYLNLFTRAKAQDMKAQDVLARLTRMRKISRNEAKRDEETA